MGPKKKLTKAEKDKLKKEEAERKLQEEEEARLVAEQEAKERKVREKLEDEERKKTEARDAKQRQEQMNEVRDTITQFETAKKNFCDNRRKEAKWARYMRCDGSPDPTIQGEINTFINLWREDKSSEDIDTVLKDSVQTLSLINELNFLREDTPTEQLSAAESERYKQTVEELQELLSYKLNQASFSLLTRGTELADYETMNLQKVIGNEEIKLCVWGNLSKNPRIKSFDFEEVGFAFDIPKVLGLADVAIRVLLTRFDHLSHKTFSFNPRIKKRPEVFEDEEEDTAVEESNAVVAEEEEQENPEEEEENEETAALYAQIKALEDEEEEKDTEEQKPEEEEVINIPEDGLVSPPADDYDDFEGEDDWVDLRANEVLGGVMFFDLMAMPPQPKNVNQWTMRTLPPVSEFTVMEYIADTKLPPPKQSDAATVKSESGEAAKKDERPPIGITLMLPKDVYFSEEPQVARWDDKWNVWRMDGFTENTFNEEKRQLSFKTAYFAPMALLQDVHINMPFQSWELRPRGLNHAVFTIIAAIVEVEFEVKDDLVCLTQPDDCEELSHFRGKWLSVRDFIATMKASGLNLFPNEDSSKYVSVQDKSQVLVDMFYKQASIVSSAMAFSWSKWNAEQPRERLVMQAAPTLEDEPLLEEDWQLFVYMRKRINRMNMTEFDENWSETIHPDSTFQADFWHMANSLCEKEGRQRIRDTTWQFADAIYQMLSATKLLTYS